MLIVPVSEGHARRDRGSTMDNRTSWVGPDKRVPPKYPLNLRKENTSLKQDAEVHQRHRKEF